MRLPQRLANSPTFNVAMMLVGLCLVGAGGWFIYTNTAFLADSGRAKGSVVKVIAKRGSRGMTLYYPRVAFAVPGDGRTVTFTSRIGLWPSPFSAGDEVEVAFDHAAPETAKIISFSTLWFLPACMIGLGFFTVIAGRAKLKGLI